MSPPSRVVRGGDENGLAGLKTEGGEAHHGGGAEAEILVLFCERCMWRQRSMSGEIAKRSGIKIEKISFKRNFQKSTKNWKLC